MERARERRNLVLAILIALVLHLVVGFSLAAYGGAFTPALPLDEKPVELTIVDSSIEPPPDVPKNPAYLETDPSKESAEKPKEQTFESNANSIGASELPATGDAPVPSQEGKDRSYVNLDTHQYAIPTDGSQPQPQAEAVNRPESKPSTNAAPTPRPVATPAPAPPPVATPEPEQLAMLSSTPPPPIIPQEEIESSPPPAPAAVPQTAPRPKPELAASSYRAEKEKTRITGNLTNRGPSSVNAVGTPLGRYQKVVSDAIGSRWYYYTKAKMDLASIGTVRIEAEVDDKGQIQNMRIVSNNANEAFANICLQSFQEAHIPPIPPDLVPTLPGGRLPVDFTFTLYANQY
jgi:outer membrane biosynthesis protein TonB